MIYFYFSLTRFINILGRYLMVLFTNTKITALWVPCLDKRRCLRVYVMYTSKLFTQVFLTVSEGNMNTDMVIRGN